MKLLKLVLIAALVFAATKCATAAQLLGAL